MRAAISKLSNELADATEYLPSYDQKTYSVVCPPHWCEDVASYRTKMEHAYEITMFRLLITRRLSRVSRKSWTRR